MVNLPMPTDQSGWLDINVKADSALELPAKHTVELLPPLLILPELAISFTVKRHERGALIAFLA